MEIGGGCPSPPDAEDAFPSSSEEEEEDTDMDAVLVLIPLQLLADDEEVRR